ncbi:MAG: hypothetical protein VX005_05600, partial [Pseudomonadota bacterium]|nr:hypothetical protein [Pseudomonadota bacterium]
MARCAGPVRADRCTVSDLLVQIDGGEIIAGVDEVGRGPLAGPVVAAAVILPRPIDGLADSKALSAAK